MINKRGSMKTLAIINEKGGVGKSFIATQFALFCRFKLGNRVLVGKHEGCRRNHTKSLFGIGRRE